MRASPYPVMFAAAGVATIAVGSYFIKRWWQMPVPPDPAAFEIKRGGPPVRHDNWALVYYNKCIPSGEQCSVVVAHLTPAVVMSPVHSTWAGCVCALRMTDSPMLVL